MKTIFKVVLILVVSAGCSKPIPTITGIAPTKLPTKTEAVTPQQTKPEQQKSNIISFTELVDNREKWIGKEVKVRAAYKGEYSYAAVGNRTAKGGPIGMRATASKSAQLQFGSSATKSTLHIYIKKGIDLPDATDGDELILTVQIEPEDRLVAIAVERP